MNIDAHTLTATEALRLIETGVLSSVEWIMSCAERIRQREPEIRAWAYINEQVVGDVEERIRGDCGPSIPIGVKDIIDVLGLPTMMGTDFHDSTPAIREGGSIAILREAGCVFMGKTATTELGHRHPGPTRNPKDTRHTPGGSSSGSAAAVADFMVPICLGTQTSGSVIRPASYCGVLGYKPTYGDFDKTGILANAPSMDTLGILARSVDDIGLLRQLLLEEKVDEVGDVALSTLSFGILRAPPWEMADAEVRDLIEGFAGTLTTSGARVVDIQLDLEVSRLQVLHRLTSGYEFRRSIAFERTNYLDHLSPVLRNGRLADGERVHRLEYQSALQELATLRIKLSQFFGEVDILIAPSASGAAPSTLENTGDAAFNSAWTLAGNPVITLPLFHSEGSGLPIGCQFIAGVAQDDLLLAVAKKIMMFFGPPDFAA